MKRGRRRVADVDITPLIDVLFMLIIFFVLTTAFVQGSLDVDLPKGMPRPLAARNPIILTMGGDASLTWAGKSISRAELAPLVSEAVANSDDILIAGDVAARYGDVAELLNTLRGMGVDQVGLAFEEERP
jgi:biopolymer transport protein ExbD